MRTPERFVTFFPVMDIYQRRRLVALSAVAVAFIVLVLLFRSCGGDDEPVPAEPLSGATGAIGVTPLPLADYIAQADQVCLESNTALAAVDDSDAEAAAAEKGQILTSQVATLQTLSLAPGEDGEDKLAKFLGALQDQAVDYGDLITASERGDDTQVAELDTAIAEAQAEAEKAARNLGFEVCGDLKQVGESTETGGSGDGDADATDVATDTATGTDTVTEAPVTPPAETVTPVEPAPTDTAGGTAPVTPAPTDAPTNSGSGGVTP